MEKKTVKNIILDYIPIAITAFLIIYLGIINKQLFIKMLPCLITLFVGLFNAKVNKIAFLIGATNCIIYSIGYFMEGLFGSMANALLYSMPLQIVSFVLWSKHKYKNAVEIKEFNLSWRIYILIGTLVSVAISCYVFSLLPNMRYVLFEGTTFILGLFATVLIMIRRIEAIFFQVLSSAITIAMWIIIVFFEKESTGITYLILGIYNFYRAVQMAVNWIKVYREQKGSPPLNAEENQKT